MKKLMKFFKELFSAYYLNGEIHNCEFSGLVWHHENRHKEQFEMKFNKFVVNWGVTWSAYLGLAFVVLAVINFDLRFLWFVGFIFTPLCLWFLYLEIDAWFVAVYRRFFK